MANTKAFYMKFNYEQLLDALVTDTANGKPIREAILEKSYGRSFYKVIKSDILMNLHTAQRAPKKTLDELSKEPENYCEFYQAVLESGWPGKGMYNPIEALDGMRASIRSAEPWEDLPGEAKKFFASVKYHYFRWDESQKAARRRA